MSQGSTGSAQVLVVGAGFAGAVVAERLARVYDLRVQVVDRRDHVAGMAHDALDAHGIRVQSYGPHYFRTNSQRVLTYLSEFTAWHPVEYRAAAFAEGRYWPFPISLETYEALIGRPATSEAMSAYLASQRVPVAEPRNSEELILSQVGPELHALFYAGYTRKQWRREARELPPSVAGRIPVRTTRDRRYLTERFQAVPRDGYVALFERLLDHPNIRVSLATPFALTQRDPDVHVVYTGPLDALFDHALGPLPWRSLRWERETVHTAPAQPEMQVNYPNEHEFTRVLEPRWLMPHPPPGVSTLVREYPVDWRPGLEPYYALPTAEAKAHYARYKALAAEVPNLTVLGRLGSYINYNMDQVTAQALEVADTLGPHLTLRRGKA